MQLTFRGASVPALKVRLRILVGATAVRYHGGLTPPSPTVVKRSCIELFALSLIRPFAVASLQAQRDAFEE